MNRQQEALKVVQQIINHLSLTELEAIMHSFMDKNDPEKVKNIDPLLAKDLIDYILKNPVMYEEVKRRFQSN